MKARHLAACIALIAAPVHADGLALHLPPDAVQTQTRSSGATDYHLLIGPWNPAGGPSRDLEGGRSDTAWRLPANTGTTLQILAPLRDQLTQAGYAILYECETAACGGFDFRFALDLLAEPEMHVDLGDFRYLAARRGDDWVALTVSRSSGSGFVQMTEVATQTVTGNTSAAPAPGAPDDFGARIEAQGSVALDDLAFDSGAADLDAEPFASLRALADYLAAHPDARVTLVGHTDATGALAANIALSKQRADAVRQRLVSDYGVSPGQITAEGAGWLAPRASNQTEDGREKNRRVEAVLTSTRN